MQPRNLERRLNDLERASEPANQINTIIFRGVYPGRLDAEVHRITGPDGGEWLRADGETEQELEDRATREVKRNDHGFAQLFAFTSEVNHA